jgi:hypothetical protein
MVIGCLLFKVDVIIIVVNSFIYFHIPLICCSFKKQFLKSGPFLSRLETRTKEYNMWARVKVIQN